MASHACQHAACVCRDVRSARVGPSVTVVSTAGAWLRPPSVRCSTYRFYTPSIPLRTRSARQRPSTRELLSDFARSLISSASSVGGVGAEADGALPLVPTIGEGNRWDTQVWPTMEGGLRNNANEPWGGNVSVDDITQTRLAYYASCAFVDEQIGAILGSWRRHVDSELSRTLVLFASDHGDALGDHLLWRKG